MRIENIPEDSGGADEPLIHMMILQWKVVEMTPVVERDRVEELRVAKDEVSLENAEIVLLIIVLLLYDHR